MEKNSTLNTDRKTSEVKIYMLVDKLTLDWIPVPAFFTLVLILKNEIFQNFVHGSLTL